MLCRIALDLVVKNQHIALTKTKEKQWVLLMSKTDRFVFIGETHLVTFRDNFPVPEIRSVLNDLKSKFDAGATLSYNTESTSCTYRLRDIRPIDSDFYCLLISVADEDFPDNVNEERETGRLRVLARNANESPAYSAHVLIRCIEEDDNTRHYQTIVENVKGLSLSRIERFIKYLLKEAFYEKRLGADGKEKIYYPLLGFQGNPAKTISNALNGNGKLQGVVFSKTQTVSDGLGDEAYQVEQVYDMELKIIGNLTGNTASNWIRSKVAQFRNEYKEAKIRIADNNGKIKTSKLDMHMEDVTQNFFILQEHLTDFDEELRNCEEIIRNDIVFKMKPLFITA